MVRYGMAEVKPQLEHLVFVFFFHGSACLCIVCRKATGEASGRASALAQAGVDAKLWVVWGLKEKSSMVPMSYCGQCTVGTMPCLPVHMKTKDKGVEQGAGAVLWNLPSGGALAAAHKCLACVPSFTAEVTRPPYFFCYLLIIEGDLSINKEKHFPRSIPVSCCHLFFFLDKRCFRPDASSAGP